MGKFLRNWGLVALFSILAALSAAFVLAADYYGEANESADQILIWRLKFAGAAASALLYTAGLISLQFRSRAERLSLALAPLERHLETSAKDVFGENNLGGVRANIMLVRRRRLKMICSWNIMSPREKEMKWKRGQGCAGQAWQNAVDRPVAEMWKPTVAPNLADADLSTWGLDGERQDVTNAIRWIVSTPMFEGSGKVIGILNYDSTTQGDQNVLEQDKIYQACAGWAQFFVGRLSDYGVM